MDKDEIIEQAKEKLRDGIECSDEPEAQIMREVLSLLESAKAEPPELVRQDNGAEELRKELESCYKSVSRRGDWKGHSVHFNIASLIRKACDRLDALEAKNKALAERIEKLETLLREFKSSAPVMHVPNWVVFKCEQALQEGEKPCTQPNKRVGNKEQ